MSRGLKIILWVGFGLLMAWFFGPILLGILGELLCGGVLAVGSLFEVLGFPEELALWSIPAIGLVLLVLFIRFIAVMIRNYGKKVKDPHGAHTPENAIGRGVAYVEHARAEGLPDDVIFQALRSGGWNEMDLQQVMNTLTERRNF